MLEQLDQQLEEVGRKRVRRDQLRDELPQTREALGQAKYRLDLAEFSLAKVHDEVEMYSALTLGSFVDTILGSRDRKLKQCKEEAAELQARHDELAAAVETLQCEVVEIEQRLIELETIDRKYDNLVGKKRQALLESGDQEARKLAEVCGEYDKIKEARRAVLHALETGDSLVEHLHTMSRTLGRARSKLIYRSSLGVLGMVAHAAYTRRGTKVPTGNVRNTLQRFARQIGEVPPSDNEELEAEIRRLAAVLEDTANDVSTGFARNPNTTLPIFEVATAAVGMLKHRLDEIQPKYEALQQQQRDLIASA